MIFAGALAAALASAGGEGPAPTPRSDDVREPRPTATAPARSRSPGPASGAGGPCPRGRGRSPSTAPPRWGGAGSGAYGRDVAADPQVRYLMTMAPVRTPSSPRLDEARRRWGAAAIIAGLDRKRAGTKPVPAPRGSPAKPAPSAA